MKSEISVHSDAVRDSAELGLKPDFISKEGISDFVAPSSAGFNIKIQILGGKIINAHPIL